MGSQALAFQFPQELTTVECATPSALAGIKPKIWSDKQSHLVLFI